MERRLGGTEGALHGQGDARRGYAPDRDLVGGGLESFLADAGTQSALEIRKYDLGTGESGAFIESACGACFSQDGRWIAAWMQIAPGQDPLQMSVWPVEGKHPIRLGAFGGPDKQGTPMCQAWAPDGKSVAVSCLVEETVDKEEHAFVRVKIIPVPEGEWREVALPGTKDNYLIVTSWRKDTGLLAVASSKGTLGSKLVRIDPSNGKMEDVARLDGNPWATGAAISPDGKSIVYASRGEDQRPLVLRIRSLEDGSERRVFPSEEGAADYLESVSKQWSRLNSHPKEAQDLREAMLADAAAAQERFPESERVRKAAEALERPPEGK